MHRFKDLHFICYIVAAIALFCGLALTMVSWAGVCSEACSHVHFYKFYGFSFELLGFLFFVVVFVLHLLSWKIQSLQFPVSLLIAGALGAELNFIMVQKYAIGQWCPVCLSIASFVFVAALAYWVGGVWNAIGASNKHTQGEWIMFIKRGIATGITICLGFLVAFFGVYKPETSFAAGLKGKDSPVFGNRNSSIEVYVITDWYCPACRSIEPRLDKILPVILPKVRLYFIDYPIHPESLNYVPYNLSFMINNKPKYLKIRHELHKLAEKTLTPSPDQVQAVVKPLGVKYEQLNYADVDSGIRFFKGIVDSFEVKETPVVVVANRKTLKAKKLVGAKEITEANLLSAINEVQ